MITRKHLTEVLEKFPGGVDMIDMVEDGRIVATVVSKSFHGCDEADRQERVWGYLREHFSESELRAIEFIFTNAPGEDTTEAAA